MRKCWICLGEFLNDFPIESDGYKVSCSTCGDYWISRSLYASDFPMADSERYRFSYWGRQRALDGRSPADLDSHSVKGIAEQLPNPRTSSKPDLLLLSFAKLQPIAGKKGQRIDLDRDYSLACARNREELSFHYASLDKRGHIERSMSEWEITDKGWIRVEELSVNPLASKFAFVAVWFKDDMLSLIPTAFEPAIRRAGFDPLIVASHHNERIDAKIVADIKRSRFLVADVTGGRQNVYFEAGYAIGLGRPVIWTCRHDRKKDMHFDTRQYAHILWKEASDLEAQLHDRIVATI